jgi:hypothetical protein
MNNTAFSIENKINPETGKPFGSRYAGTFSIRRPTLADKTTIATRTAAQLAPAGEGVGLLTDELLNQNFTFAQLQTIATEKLPEWFDRDKMYDESDEAAINAVSEEVGKFLDTFRPGNNSGAGAAAGGDGSVLVQTAVQLDAH